MTEESQSFEPVLYPEAPRPGEQAAEDMTQRALLQAIELAKVHRQLEIDRQELQIAEEKIKSLAKFPSENPNPILRIGQGGKLLYANPPALSLLRKTGAILDDTVTFEFGELARKSLAEKSHQELEVQVSDKIFSLEFTPIEGEGYVNVYGHDITKSKNAEIELSIQYELVKIFAESECLDEAMPKILQTVGEFLQWDLSFFWERKPDTQVLRCRSGWNSKSIADLDSWKEFERVSLETEFEKGKGLPGRIWSQMQPAWIPDISQDANFPRAPHADQLDLCSGYGFPIFSKTGFFGVIEFFTRRVSQKESPHFQFLANLGCQIGQFAERKIAQGAVLTERKNLYAMLNNLAVSMHVESGDGSIRFANKKFREKFGDPDRPACRDMLKNRSPLEGGSSLLDAFSTENRSSLIWKGPNDSVYLSLQTEFQDLDGSPLNLETSIDMTRQIRAEKQLRVYARKLERSNNELEDFASIASHDLKEPLRKIVTLGEMLKDKSADLDPVIDDCVNRMQNAASRMTTLIEDLLQYACVTENPAQTEMVDLGKIVEQVLETLEVALKKSGGQVHVENLPTLEVDPTQMRQLLQNLIGNALKYHHPETAPSIHLRGVCDGEGGWEIQVQDNGIGFEQKYAERVLKPFERLHGRSAYEGSGMGLAICNKIVARHHGTLRLESEPKKGCKVILTLPEKQP